MKSPVAVNQNQVAAEKKEVARLDLRDEASDHAIAPLQEGTWADRDWDRDPYVFFHH